MRMKAVLSMHRAAEQHSLDMASNNFFSHTGSDGSGLGDRAANANFFTFPLGENIAAGYNSVRDTVLAWMWCAAEPCSGHVLHNHVTCECTCCCGHSCCTCTKSEHLQAS